MVSLHVFVAANAWLIGAWILYSKRVQKAVKTVARHCTIIAQTRPEGDGSLLVELAQGLPQSGGTVSDFDILIWGDKVSNAIEIKGLGSDLIVVRDNENNTGIFSKTEIPKDKSLRELVRNNGKGQQFVTDPFQFQVWTEAMLRTTKPLQPPTGTYWYSFRDYYNFEETHDLAVARGSIKMLHVRRHRVGELTIDEDGSCSHIERYWLYGLVPFSTNREGHLQGNVITWTRSFWYKGWPFLGKLIDRPPISEKMRKEPWIVRVPLDEQNKDDILVLERQDHGRLVYVKESVHE